MLAQPPLSTMEHQRLITELQTRGLHLGEATPGVAGRQGGAW
ncbi:hypothetical protein [Nodosilinea sp. P-1105]|nr:hypothetical protein [Nodosilinea sp. P-1105]